MRIDLVYLAGRLFFFFNDPATTELYPLSLHDALPISLGERRAAAGPHEQAHRRPGGLRDPQGGRARGLVGVPRSEEHTSELQSRLHLVCRLLLEKKKNDPLASHPHIPEKLLSLNSASI